MWSHGPARARDDDRLAVALSGRDILEAKEAGRIAAVIGVEGGHALGGSVAALEELFSAGVRCLTLTWMNTNEIADSADGEEKWKGLSPAGRGIVKKMNRLGVVIERVDHGRLAPGKCQAVRGDGKSLPVAVDVEIFE